MELIKRYVHEVGHHLPGGIRADVQAELYGLLGESLEERAEMAGRPPDDAMEAELLREFGRPEEVAARYASPRYLIGPHIYPAYVLTLKVIAGVVVFLWVAGLVFSLPASPLRLGEAYPLLKVGQAAWGIAQIGFSWAVAATLLFVALERISDWRGMREASWDPRKLPPLDDSERAKSADLVGEIAGAVIGAVLANRYLGYLGPGFTAFLPWLNLIWASEIALRGAVLLQGRWSRRTRVLEAVQKAVTVVLFVALLMSHPMAHLAAGLPMDPKLRELIARLTLFLVRWTILFMIAEVAWKFYRLLTRRPGAEEWSLPDAPLARQER